MTRVKQSRSWRDVDLENALAAWCYAGFFYVYAAALATRKRLRNAGRTLVGVVRTAPEVYRLVQRIRSSTKKNAKGSKNSVGRVEVFQAQVCKKPSPSNRRRLVEYSRKMKKVASFPLRDL